MIPKPTLQNYICYQMSASRISGTLCDEASLVLIDAARSLSLDASNVLGGDRKAKSIAVVVCLEEVIVAGRIVTSSMERDPKRPKRPKETQ